MWATFKHPLRSTQVVEHHKNSTVIRDLRDELVCLILEVRRGEYREVKGITSSHEALLGRTSTESQATYLLV